MKEKAVNIGKKIVVNIKENIICFSYKKRNGYKDQLFRGVNLPEKVEFQCWGTEEINGFFYEKYVSKDFLIKFFKVSGISGWEYGIPEMYNLCQKIFREKTEDGLRILGARALKIDDINKIVNLKLNYEKGIIYQKDYPFDKLGTLRSIKKIDVNPFLYDNEEIFYKYSLNDLNISPKIRNMICISKPYILASGYVCPSTCDKDISVGLYTISKENNIDKYDLAVIEDGENINTATRIDLCGGIRPVIFLKKND